LRPFLIDTDTASDDAVALLLALRHPEIDVRAITVVAGNVPVDQGVQNALYTVELAGADTPVYRGATGPRIRELHTGQAVHGEDGMGDIGLEVTGRGAAAGDAVQVLIEEIERRPGEVTLVTLGPLTNLAVALELEPALPGLLGRWVMMGGAFHVPGNTTAVSEWNIHCDPEAAHSCFEAWTAAIRSDPSIPRMSAMGLDVTERAVIGPPELEALAARAAGNPALQRTILDALRFYFEFHERYDGFYGAHIHDPLVAACALDASLITATEPASIEVDASGGAGDGRTIADWSSPTPNADVALDADVATFVRRLLERVAAASDDGRPGLRGG
jgi:purine nucleosidase